MKKIVLLFIFFYKKLVSFPLKLFFGGGCRFYPTCSDYTKEAIDKYGTLKGFGLSLNRVLRCHPGSPISFDPVN